MTTAKTNKQKRDAIANRIGDKKSISFTYKEETERRAAFPYTLGLIKNKEEKDEEGVRVYLTEKGESKSDFVSGVNGQNSSQKDPNGTNFRLIYLKDMDDVVEETEEFVPHKLYEKGDKMFSRIIKQVD